ncbi:Ig-like domain repeat protein, partial [Methanobrevibacter sp.]|uniref:Ig-like domain repeat protein n=1 Tax=Methanobrevibacter sp. TaxID=66852 RepID=UPI00388FB047
STGNVWVQGGALYLRVDSKAVINNSVFVNCSSDKEAGAIYVQSKSNLDVNNPILIENTKFISNVAKAIAPNVYGGGAVQVKECNNIYFTNVSFINNTANNGGALSVYNTAEPVKFIDCVFIGNNATQNGGSIWFNKRLYLYNITISDSYAENFGGGMYNENAELIHNNLTFINNTALNGGGIYWNRNNINIHDMVFLNNTALQYGGAIYISKGGNSLSNVNMTGNKAFSGSAIYSTAAFTLTDAYLIENQANSSSLTFDSYDESTGKIVLLFKGKDKYLNAIYVTGSNRPTCTNVTYWNENGVANTGSSAVTLPNAADPTPEAGQNITVGVYDDNGNLLNPDDQYFITDKNGKIYLDFHDVVPGVSPEQYGEIYVEAILTNDDYYTIIKLTSRAPSSINASATNTTYHSNSTLSVNVTHGATGNVSVYLNDTFIGNITLDNSMGSMEISTLIEDKYLHAGNHTLTFVYNGNAKYDKSNTTAILEIGKITPTLLVDVTGIEYNLVVNVTVMDGEYNISDATGDVTIEVADRTTTIYLANGQGMTVIYGLPIGNYTVNATYNGDNNYYNTTNSTYGNVTEKVHTVIVLDVDNNKTYFINETVPIKVTVLPNAEGNITLYINGEPHVLTLQTVDNITFVEFNATELKDGVNYVFATYEGTDMYGPSWAEDSFNVTKYNATVIIKTDNITRGDTEVINITVPEDATGILNVTVNGTPYYIEIINGNATLPISGLEVGVYNVTVTFMGDKKYYNATNSTLFNVSKATPSIIVSVENITYGENATVIVTVPEGAKGNVTIKLNETVVFTQEPIDGQATFTLENLKASNYTIEATFNGNENYTNASNSTNFTVFKATPELNVTVEDIYYGDAEHIIIKVNADGNVTVRVNGNETVLNITSAGNETYVYDLAVGNYPVEVTFNGNENYTEVTVTKDFNVYQANTTLDVDVHDIVVWDKESINVTVAENATGNVIININGVNHTVPIANGTAQLNLTNLTVGHKVVWVFYDGDRNYTANRTMAEFDVGQRTPKVNVTALNVTVDQEGKITINIPANATGFVVLSGNFTKRPIYVDEFTDGVAEITVDDLAVGKYSVHIKYYGDALDNYTVAENDTTFTVGKINATVTIDADNVTYGNSTTIVVTVPEGVTGNITLKLNDTAGRNITLPIVDGKVTWIVDGLAAGNYTVNATYNGNDDYNINNTESAKFEVKKADPGLDFIVDGVVYENATVKIYINDEIHGKVANVTVDGMTYTNVSVDEEFMTQVLSEFKPYTVIVEYGGNENFTSARVEQTFTPSKVTNYGINVTAMNITVGDDEIITVEVPDHVDDVVIWVNGTQYRNNSFSGNTATFNVTGLKEGVYTVTATVNDTEFEHKNFTTIFTVSKTYPSINITVVNETSIYVNDTVKVIVTVPSDATEDVTIEINGMEFTNSTVNGNATFYIPQITFGNKTVVATYPGDDKYRFNATTANFTVNKRKSFVNVTVDAGTVGDDTVINVTIPANATGYVIVNVDGTNYTVNTTNGNGSITIKDLGNTTHTVKVTYIGDDQYLPSDNETSFGIPKANTTIAIAVESIDYGQKANITVTVKDDATGYITIKINDTQEITLPVVNGTVNWIVDGLAADNYTVYANYSGDGKYNVNATDKDFEVRQISPEIKIISVVSTAGENATIIVEIDPRTTENITVHVDKDYSVKPVNGIAVVTTDVLDYGNYTVNASYAGDKNFTKDYDIYKFTTNQTDDYLINITASDINVGDNTNITVNVPADATGKVIIELNGTNYTATINDGKAVLDNVSTLKEGVYDVTAYFGDDKYANKTVSTRFAVSKVDTPIAITVVNDTSILVNDTVKVIVTVPEDVTENVTIEINGMEFTNSTVDGNATFYIPQITYGNKTVVATYPGDDKYRFNATTANFTVNKRQSQVNVTVDAGLVGEDTVINVTIPENAVGYVVVNVDGTNYTVNTTNGNGSITIKGLVNTTHTVHVTYLGDDQYLPSDNETSFGIAKANTTIAIAVESIDYGQKANITVTVKDDATGYITIKINDTQEITLPVVNGTVNWIVDGLAADNYTVQAEYSGDYKYNVNATDKDFEVRQISPEIKIIGVISTAGENATIIVEIDPRVSENVTVTVDDKDYSVKPVNGIAVVTTDVLDYGNYTVNASYAGDKNFTKDYDTNEFTTNQTDDYLINITASDIEVGDNTNITVNVPADATGKVIIELNGTNYTAVIAGGKAVLDNVSTLKEGVYNVTAYFGDDKYTNKTVSTRFAVSKVDTPISITVVNETGILVNDTVKVIVTVPEDVTENVTIEINGMEFTNSTVDGNATFYIPEITFGNKTVVATYPGDDKYRFNATTANFTVNKRQSQVNVTVDAGLVGDDTVINVTIPENATGYVVVNVDGTNYTVNTTNGNGSITIKGLGNTTHTVHVTYIGDDQYLPSENETTFGIPKANTTIAIAVESIDYGESANITVTVEDDATGYITIKINDTQEITLPVVNGTVNWIVDGLAAGNYTVYANYSGDDKYNVNATDKDFEVRQISPEIKIISVVSAAGENATIIVEIDPRVSENITVHVDKDYSVKPVNGIAVVTTDVLDYGNYTVNASYAGDKNFTKDYDTYEFTTNQTDDYLINITASDIEVGDNTNITVNVPGDATGKVIIELNGTNYTAVIAGGKAVLDNVSTLKEGVYNVTAYFGDDKYANKTVETRFVVSKVDTPIAITVVNDTSIYVNDTVKVIVTVPSDVTENVTIEINGMEFTNSTVNGNATFYIPQITYGNKTVVATYPGDDKYRFNSTTANFTVNKRDSFINVNATDGVVDGEVIINVTVPENAVGYVVVNVNGTNYTINLTNGDDRVAVKVTEAGLYNVTVTYIGDDQFLPSNNTTSFKVDKLPSFINATVNDNGIIVYGSDVYINITAPEDITGNVTVIVWDKDRNVNTTYDNVYVNGGKAELHIAAPAIGNYSVKAIYIENRKYLGNENYTSFEVYDPAKELEVDPQDIIFGSDEIVNVLIDGNHVGDTLTIIITNASGEVIRNESVKIDRYISQFNISSAEWTVGLTLDAGKYNASAIYVEVVGDKTYIYEDSDSFEVYKANSTITIKEIRNVTVGDNVTIELEVSPDAATGNISVFVNGVEYKTTTDNLTITIPNLRVDNYTVEAFYHGNKNYNESNASSSFRVDKIPVPLSIDIENSGDVVLINVTVGNNATGEILLDIEDNHYYANITNGVAQFNITGLKAGNHNVTARYVENDKYYGNTTNSSFTISKYQPEFTINGTDIDFGDAELITIETKDDITSLVEVEVNGRNYTTFIKNGKGNLTLNDLAAGDYNITLYFPSNEKYEAATANGSFKVSQIAPDINVIVQNITYGEVETVTVYVNAEGNVTIEVGGYEFIEKPLINGSVSVDVPYLNANNYTVNVTFNGNVNYTRSNAKANFTVYKADPIITIEVEDIFYGDIEHIIVHVNAEGNVTVIVDNRTVEEISLENGEVTLRAARWDVPDYNGNATVNVEGLDVGHYPVVAIFNGNENYNKATKTVDFEVYKVNTTVSVEAEPSMKIGESQVIKITVNNTNATGNVIVIVDGVNNTVPLTNGTANFTIEALTSGNHSIVVIYEGDNNLNGNWTSATFEVTKLDAPINMTISNSTVGGKQTITVEVPENATGQVLIDIDGTPYYANVTDGKAVLEIDTLPEGEHDVVATYLGDDVYKGNSTSGKFNVTKNNSTLEIAAQNITYGDSETITFTVPEDATGNITVVVNNETYTVPVSGGTGTLTIPKLPAGNYTIDATYNGDGKYEPVSNSTSFEVSKANTDLKVIDQNNGTVVVVVGDNATGNITIKVGDNNYTAEIVNGTAVIDLVNETPGEHDLEVIYSGDDNHEAATTNGTATIPKLETPISVKVDDIEVGDTAEIVVTVPDDAKGNVTIEIDGEKYTAPIENGKATFDVENLTAGNKTIAVDYVGDNNYTGNHTTANLTVDKRESTVKAETTPINVGETAVIEITVPDNATGYVIVEIANQTYAVEVENGTGTLEVDGLASGTHDINVKYLGDDQYLPSNSTTTIEVSKVPSTINVTAENITVGDKAVINVEVPEDVCGNVTVTVDDQNYTVFVSGGKGTLVIPDLEAGDYTVDAIFAGCKKYEPSNATTKFTVSKVTTDDIKVINQNNGTLTVVVGDDATGNVTVKVGNETYTAEVVNGTAVIDLVNNTPGTYDVEVIYSGDDKHSNGTATSKATIPKLETPISVEVSDINVGDTAEIVVTVPDDATGDVTIEVDGVKYTAPIENGKATFNIENLTAGNKTIAVDYVGDNNYTGNHTTAKIAVSKCESSVSATIDDSNVGDNVTVTVTVPEDATGQVLVDIDGVGYYVNVTNGTGTAQIPRIPSGVYNVTVTYPGDDKYLPSSNTTTFNVSKVESFVIPQAQDIYVGDNEQITFSVPEDATGTITVVIDGKEYDFELDEDKLSIYEDTDESYVVAVSYGKGKLTVSGLPRGDYIVSARYNGDDKYLPSTNTTTFKVLKKSPIMDVTDLGNGTVVVDLPDDATGNVTIKVGDNTYTAPVVDGRAVIDLTNETPGTHDIEVTYSGDDKYNSDVEDSTATIPKYDTPISVEVDDINVGDTAVVTVTLPDDATGTVTIEINGKEYTADVKDGKAVFNVTGLEAGNKTVAVKYDGDDNYVSNSTTGQFTVSKVNSTIEASGKDIKVGNDEVITVTLPSDATGRVLVEIDGVGYYGTAINGKAKIIIPELPSGDYTVTVNYEGDDKYLPSSTTTSFKVTKSEDPISATGDEITEGEDATVVVTLPEDATGNVTIIVDGKEYTTDVKDGKAVFTIPDLPEGNYNVDVYYSGDKKYDANSTTTEIIVHAKSSEGEGGEEVTVKHPVTELSLHPTGNPILVLLLVILVMGSTQLRRFKK